MNLIPLQPKLQSELFNVMYIQINKFDVWRHLVPLHISSSFSNGLAEDLRKNFPIRAERRKLSSLKGKVTKMSSEEINKQLDFIRDEWQRDI